MNCTICFYIAKQGISLILLIKANYTGKKVKKFFNSIYKKFLQKFNFIKFYTNVYKIFKYCALNFYYENSKKYKILIIIPYQGFQ